MIRVLVAIAILFAAVLALDWLGGVPVSVAIEWPGGSVAPPLRVAVVALVVFAVLAVILWTLLSGLLHTPGAVRDWFRSRRRDRGYTALSRGMIAVGSGDVRLAHRFAAEADKLLPQEPLVLLLDAQTAQLEGRSDDARTAFTRMLDNQDTRLLGLRGLFIEATRAGEMDAARHYASEAQRIAPGIPWAGTAMMEYQSLDEDWAGALATLDQNASARLIDKAEAKRLRAVLLTARALQAEDADPDRARGYALEAHRLVPAFVPATVVAARVLTRLQDPRKAAKVIETTWKANPHPELADAYVHVRTGDSSRDRLKRARALAALKPHHIEGVVAVAKAALAAQDYALARENLAKALRQQATQRVCLMMAELEESEHGDRGRVREWLARALRAPRDEAWTADGVVSETWQPTSPVTGRLDAFEWRVPVASDTGVTELDGSDLAERAVRPLEPPKMVIEPVADAPATPDGPPRGPDDEGGGGTVADAPAVEVIPPKTAGEDAEPARPVAAAALVADAPKPAAFSDAAARAPSAPAAQPDRPTPSQRPEAAARSPAPQSPPASAGSAVTEDGERNRAEYPMPFRPDDPGPEPDAPKNRPMSPTAAFA